MSEIIKVLMERDGMAKEDAEEVFDMAKLELNERLQAGELPSNFCQEYFGLEEDYLFELI